MSSTTEPVWVRRTLISIALGFIFLFLILPLAAVFTEALRKGFGAYLEALKPAADGEEGGEAGTGKPGSGRVTSAAPTKGGKAPDRKAGGKEAVVVVDPESLLPVRGWCEAPKTMQQVWGWCEAAGPEQDCIKAMRQGLIIVTVLKSCLEHGLVLPLVSQA